MPRFAFAPSSFSSYSVLDKLAQPSQCRFRPYCFAHPRRVRRNAALTLGARRENKMPQTDPRAHGCRFDISLVAPSSYILFRRQSNQRGGDRRAISARRRGLGGGGEDDILRVIHALSLMESVGVPPREHRVAIPRRARPPGQPPDVDNPRTRGTCVRIR